MKQPFAIFCSDSPTRKLAQHVTWQQSEGKTWKNGIQGGCQFSHECVSSELCELRNTFWRSIENCEVPSNLDFFVSQAAPLRKVPRPFDPLHDKVVKTIAEWSPQFLANTESDNLNLKRHTSAYLGQSLKPLSWGLPQWYEFHGVDLGGMRMFFPWVWGGLKLLDSQCRALVSFCNLGFGILLDAFGHLELPLDYWFLLLWRFAYLLASLLWLVWCTYSYLSDFKRPPSVAFSDMFLRA